jgi:hypothetical protein
LDLKIASVRDIGLKRQTYETWKEELLSSTGSGNDLVSLPSQFGTDAQSTIHVLYVFLYSDYFTLIINEDGCII